MNTIVIHVCEWCGAVLLDKTFRAIPENEDNTTCPFCHDKYSGHLNTKIKKAFADCTNIPDWDFEVDAVFVEDNHVSNPRLVVRFADHYFYDWQSLQFPSGFRLVCTRNSSYSPCPVELVHYFDAAKAKDADDFYEELDHALDVLLEWLHNFPVL